MTYSVPICACSHIQLLDVGIYLDMVPQLSEFQFEPITGAVLHEATRGLKKVSMRGCDGWAYGELKLLPEVSLDVLATLPLNEGPRGQQRL